VVSKSRSPIFPDVLTLKEAVNDDARTTWFGLFTQAATPKPIATRIAAEIDRIVNRPDFKKRMFTDRAVEPATERLDEFARFIREERQSAQQIVEESGQPPI
jgi:tripartite-type tricarboxylate transporter receptor subunit TctC